MDKADKFLKSLIEQVNELAIDARLVSNQKEGYSVEYARNGLILRANTPLELVQGVCRSFSLWKAGYASEIPGHKTPFFRLRPFCLESSSLFNQFFSVPPAELRQRVEILCENLIALGCNSLWLTNWEKRDWLLPLDTLDIFCKTAEEYGLSFGAPAFQAGASMEYVLHYCEEWESPLPREINDKGISKSDWIIQSIITAWEALGPKQKLVIYVPTITASMSFWEKILTQLPERCLIAFSNVHARGFLALSRAFSSRFMEMFVPIISTGYHGGGLWPIIHQRENELIFSQVLSKLWYGVGLSGPFIPIQGTLYHGLVWCLSQKLFQPEISDVQWITQWFDTYCQEIRYDSVAKPLMELAELAWEVKDFSKNLKSYSYDRQKGFIEMALSKVKYVSAYPFPESLQGDVMHCLTDLRRILLYHLLQEQISIPQIVDEKDLKGGIWTSMQGCVGQAIRSGVTVRLLDTPNPPSEEALKWWNTSAMLN